MVAGLRVQKENDDSGKCLSIRQLCPDKKQKRKMEVVSVDTKDTPAQYLASSPAPFTQVLLNTFEPAG